MKIKNMSGRIHPLMAAAAVSVTLVSLIGAAAITGILPTSKATQGAPAADIASTTPQVQTALMAPAQQPVAQAQQPVVQSQQHNQIASNGTQKTAVHHAKPAQHSQPHRTSQVNEGMQQQAAVQTCLDCGRVESVESVQTAAPASGLGVGVGAVVGGLLGNQVGKGNGRTLATIAGAVGGGYAGNEVEKRTHTATTYQVRVRMEDGQMRTFTQSGNNGWRSGDKVRVVNGELSSRG